MCRNKISVAIFIVVSFCCLSQSSRIYFSKCGAGGFSCVLNNKKYNITYQCPPTETDPTFFLWQFRAPSNIETLTIANCNNFKISFQCTGENKPLQILTVTNVSNLFFLKTVNTHTPPDVRLENIKNLEYLPENAFSQIKRRFPISGCLNPARDFQNLYLSKVNIGTVAPKAFNDLKDFGNFSWLEVNVKRLQHLAIEVQFNKAGNFSIRKSNIEICEQLAFKLVGPQAVFLENKFVEIYSGGINGTIRTFVFTMNTVDNVQPYAFSILSETVHIFDNKFEYLQNGAFEKISPGLLENSHVNFGSLRFIYEFSYNSVNFMDAGSLNPDMPAYDNVATDLKFHHNNLICTCENIGWLFSGIGYGYKTSLMQEFYETITEVEYKNWCSYTSCELLIYFSKKLVSNGICLENKTAESLCEVEKAVTVASLKLNRTDKTVGTADGSKSDKNALVCIICIILVATIFG